MRAIAPVVLGLLLPAPALAQARPEAKPSEAYRDQIVAEVEHEPITLHELELAARLTASYRELKDNKGDKGALRGELHRQLELLMDERVLLLECNREKITLSKDDEKKIEREVDRQAEPHGGLDGLKVLLAKIGVPYEYFVERKRTKLLIGKLLLKNVSRDIYVEPERIRKYYDEHKDQKFRCEAVTKWFQIDVYPSLQGSRVPDEVKDQAATWNGQAARAFADRVRERATQSPTEWRGIAQSSTMDASMVDRGGLVQVAGDQKLADQGILGAAAERLKPGEVSPVIVSRVGYHVLCMKERSPVSVLPFSEVQREIHELLRNEIWQERLKAWIRKLKEDTFSRTYLPAE